MVSVGHGVGVVPTGRVAATASDLVYAALWMKKHRTFQRRLVEGDMTFDRALATTRPAVAGADETTSQHSESLDLAGVGRLAARQRGVTRIDEKTVFEGRFAVVQPNLDESAWRVSGVLPGVGGKIFADVLSGRADELRLPPGGDTCTRGQHQADALVAMAMDSTDRNGDSERAGSGPSVAVFVDLDRANGTGGEYGEGVEHGPRVGPDTLEELLCTGTVQIVGLASGEPVVTSRAARAIPPAVRRLVAARDGGCTIRGCASRYCLEPHHIVHRSDGGSHDPENLTTRRWFHHHIAIHQQEFRVDPDSTV